MTISQIINESKQSFAEPNFENGFFIMPRMARVLSDLTKSEICVLLAIYEHYNTVTGTCFASQEVIMDYLGMTRRATVSEAIANLISRNLIRVIPARLTKNGKLTTTSNDIIIIPFDKIHDEAYIAEIDAELNRIRYLVVEYTTERGKTFRKVVGSGTNSDSMTPSEMNNYREHRRQESLTDQGKVENHTQSTQAPRQQDDSQELLEQGRFYFHPALQIAPGAPVMQINDDGTITEMSEPFYLEIVASFTINDLIDYFCKKARILQPNYKRDAGGFRHIIAEITINEPLNALDLILFTIDEAVAQCSDRNKRLPTSAIELSNYLDDATPSYEEKYNNCKMVGLDHVIPRKSSDEFRTA